MHSCPDALYTGDFIVIRRVAGATRGGAALREIPFDVFKGAPGPCVHPRERERDGHCSENAAACDGAGPVRSMGGSDCGRRRDAWPHWVQRDVDKLQVGHMHDTCGLVEVAEDVSF